VNLQHVSGFTDKELLIGSEDNVDRVSMSRGKKAAVLDALLAMKSGL
jgi:hypothetical protein